ncbi:MAG: DNA metabolism protein [Lawsonibacter sp.]|nr:DNA metabolism protein [Lawsonibacter sp.]
MDWTPVCYEYDGTFAGFLTCVFDSWVNREEPAEFRWEEGVCGSLYPVTAVETDRTKAERVYRSFRRKFGYEGRELVVRGFLTCLPEREVWLWRLIQKGYSQGPSMARDLTDPVVDRVRKAVYHLNHEAHLYTGFVRFSELEGVLVGEIEPKNRVLPLLRLHFCGRYPQERFVLYDRTHREALLHQPGRWAILPAEDVQPGPAGPEERTFRKLWRAFYDTIAIQARTNPKCRMTQMPKRYWGCMTEFQPEEPPALPEHTKGAAP